MRAFGKLFSVITVITVLFSCSMFDAGDDDSGSGDGMSNTVTVRSMSSSNETFHTFEDATIDFWIEDQLGNTDAVAAPEVSNGGFSMTFLEWDSVSGQPTGNTWQGEEGASYNLNGFINTEGNIHTQDSGEPGLRSAYPITLNGSQIVIFEPTDFEVTSIAILFEGVSESKVGADFIVGVFENGADPTVDNPITGMKREILNTGSIAGNLHLIDSNWNDTGHYGYVPDGFYDFYYLIDEDGDRQLDPGEYHREETLQPDVSWSSNSYVLTFPYDFQT